MRLGGAMIGIAMLAACKVETPAPAPAPGATPAPTPAASPAPPPIPIKPGEWRFTREIVDVAMLGAPDPLANEIRRQMAEAQDRETRSCVEKADPREALVEPILSIQPGGRCDRPRLAASGGSMIGVMRCRIGDGGERRVTIRAMTGGEEVVINTRSRISGSDLPGDIVADVRITGRRVGDCPAAATVTEEKKQ